MKNISLMISSALLLLSLLLLSGCSQHSNNLSGNEYYDDDVYKMVPKTRHEKRFPGGHVNTHENDRKAYQHWSQKAPLTRKFG